MRQHRPDRFFFLLTIVLSVVGLLVFSSAALGLLGRDGASFVVVAGKQLFVLLVALAVFLLVSSIPYKNWEKWAPYIFGASVVLTLLVFVPGLALQSGGAKRWLLIPLGGESFSFQPAEFLKLGFILIWAAWLARFYPKVRSIFFGFLPFLAITSVLAIILLAQPNTSTLGLIVISGAAMLLVAGGKWSHFLILALIGLLAFGAVVMTRPYVKARVMTYLNPSLDPTGDSYQLNQSLIAIGSGGIMGRGFGQSMQKFNYLPEPMGDSIFAVASEEFGLLGSTTLLILFLLFGLWGLKIASRVSDPFGRLTALGIVILISAQCLVNIGAMIGLMPLTGVPLVFVSQGGSALLLALIEAGIVLNISRYRSTA